MKQRGWLWAVVIVGVIVVTCGACVGGTMLLTLLPAEGEWGFGDAVAVVYVEGVILSGDPVSAFQSAAYSGRIAEELRWAEEDPSVRAIVLRINSPGGSMVASDEVYQALTMVSKPMVASMGEIAASGGYYIACAADEIIANEGTMTGSIGVLMELPNAEELMEKLGVEVVIIRSGPHKGEGNLYNRVSDEEAAVLQEIVDEAFERFVTVVSQGREMDFTQVKRLADGRLYSGRRALSLGLIDGLGNLPEAIARAAELGGIEGQPRIVEYRRPPTLFETLVGALSRPPATLDWRELLGMESTPSLQYRYIGP